jgi:dienelactone hydrolase
VPGTTNKWKLSGTPTGKLVKVADKHDAYVATPAAGKEHKGVGILLLPDVIGIWQNSKLTADQFAANGYLTLLLDTFNGDALPLGERPKDFNFMDWLTNGTGGNNPHTKDAVDPIVVDGIKALKEEYGVTKIGAVGYCFGAKVCLYPHIEDTRDRRRVRIRLISALQYVVRHYKDGINVGYVAHPSFVDEEELEAITGPLSISAAETDAIFPAEKRHRSEEILKKTGQPDQLNLFSGVDHGFAVRGDQSVQVQRFAKEQAFLQAVTWFNEFLL